jgi:hypothetical protein
LSDIYSSSALSTTRSHLPVKFDNHFKVLFSVSFAWRFKQLYPSGVFWMSAESSDALEDSITSLAIDVDTTGQNSKETLKRTFDKTGSRFHEINPFYII